MTNSENIKMTLVYFIIIYYFSVCILKQKYTSYTFWNKCVSNKKLQYSVTNEEENSNIHPNKKDQRAEKWTQKLYYAPKLY
jgi:hypothetical protein